MGSSEAPDLLTRTLAEHQPSVDANNCAKSDGDVCPGDKSSDGPSSACVMNGERGFHTHIYMCIKKEPRHIGTVVVIRRSQLAVKKLVLCG